MIKKIWPSHAKMFSKQGKEDKQFKIQMIKIIFIFMGELEPKCLIILKNLIFLEENLN